MSLEARRTSWPAGGCGDVDFDGALCVGEDLGPGADGAFGQASRGMDSALDGLCLLGRMADEGASPAVGVALLE